MAAFAQFEVGRLTAETLATPFPKEKSDPHALTTQRYGLKGYELYKALWHREIILVRRNSFLWVFRATMVSLAALLVSPLMSSNLVRAVVSLFCIPKFVLRSLNIICRPQDGVLFGVYTMSTFPSARRVLQPRSDFEGMPIQ